MAYQDADETARSFHMCAMEWSQQKAPLKYAVLSQHNAADVSSFEGVCNQIAAGISTRAAAC